MAQTWYDAVRGQTLLDAKEKVIELTPEYWPGFLDKGAELKALYEGEGAGPVGLPPPFNKTMIKPWEVFFKGQGARPRVSTSCTLVDCRSTLADANVRSSISRAC